MNNKKINYSNISILSACDVNLNLLLEFYNVVWPTRANHSIWKWLNRTSFYDNKVPLVIIYEGKIIAHAGMIPFNVLINGDYYSALWYIDLVVLPEFQKKGFGTLLSEKWMEISDICLGGGYNIQSRSVLKALGWIESSDTYLHIFPLIPFDHPRYIRKYHSILRKLLNIAYHPVLVGIYHKYASSINDLHFAELDSDSLNKFVATSAIKKTCVVPARNSEYLKWRVLNSPDKNKYRVYSVDDISMIIKLGDNHGKYMDMLLISDKSNFPVIRKMISTLALWGIRKGFSFIRLYTSNKEFSDYLKKSLKSKVQHPGFIYYSKNDELLKRIKKYNWDWELIDNDFEWF